MRAKPSHFFMTAEGQSNSPHGTNRGLPVTEEIFGVLPTVQILLVASCLAQIMAACKPTNWLASVLHVTFFCNHCTEGQIQTVVFDNNVMEKYGF